MIRPELFFLAENNSDYKFLRWTCESLDVKSGCLARLGFFGIFVKIDILVPKEDCLCGAFLSLFEGLMMNVWAGKKSEMM